MKSFTLRILANNEAGSWASWPEKIAAIKQFYASVCTLDVILTPTKLTPQFAPYAPTSGSGTIYQVDEAWYEANVAPIAEGADIVMFVVPPSDHTVPCLMGLEAGHPKGPWQTTIFCDEISHTYVNEIDQGETAVVYATHELSHVFYAMLAKTDNTHLYFYAGTPGEVLPEFDFEETELAWYQQVIQLLEQELGLLKARQTTAPAEPAAQTDPQVQNSTLSATQTPTSAPTSFPPKILAWAQIISKEEGARPGINNPGNLGYATLTASWGATQGPAKADGGYLAQFPTYAAGYGALCNFLVLGCEDQLAAFHEARTLEAFTKIYADNPPAGYLDAIVAAMGGDPNVQISIFLS